MPVYEIEDPQTKKVYEIDAEKMPSGAQLQTTLMQMRGAAPAAATAGMVQPSTAQDAPPQPFGSLGIQTVSDADWATKTPQEKLQGLTKAAGYALSGMVGWGKEGRDAVDHPATTLALAALPSATKGVTAAMPSKIRAGLKFQEVMQAAKNAPVDISEPGNVALRIMELAERGGTMPKAVRDFLKRVTDPEKAAFAYGEARDFASNISRLSTNDMMKMTPALKREVGNLRVALNKAVEGAARSVGKADQYKAAMREYALRSNVDDVARDVWTGVKKSWPIATATGAGLYGARTVGEWLGGGK